MNETSTSSCNPSRIRLPVESRDVRRLVNRLSPTRCGNYYVLIVCKELNCRKCIFNEKPIIKIIKTRIKDPLSGLTIKLPQAEAYLGEKLIWKSKWKRGKLTVEEINC